MNIENYPSHRYGNRRGIWILFFFLPLLHPPRADGAEPASPLPAHTAFHSASGVVTHSQELTSAVPGTAVTGSKPLSISAPLLAGRWRWREMLTSFESTFSNRRRMIQLATIGMCVGLYIMMRK